MGTPQGPLVHVVQKLADLKASRLPGEVTSCLAPCCLLACTHSSVLSNSVLSIAPPHAHNARTVQLLIFLNTSHVHKYLVQLGHL